jgi:hypothetical protein
LFDEYTKKMGMVQPESAQPASQTQPAPRQKIAE